MDIGEPQGLAQGALSPGRELCGRFHPLLLGCCGQAVPSQGTVRKGECIVESIKTAEPAPPVPSWAVLALLHHGPGPGECLLGYVLP